MPYFLFVIDKYIANSFMATLSFKENYDSEKN